MTGLVKTLSEQQTIGSRGASLFKELILSHGMSFHETGALDTGIDGFIELRDPETGEVRAQYIAVQIKTRGEGSFSQETDTAFSYICDAKDIDYWMQSNAPVILVVVRLSDRSAHWKSIRSWFEDPDRMRSRKVVFDKAKDRLDDDALPSFRDLVASFARPGLIVPGTRRDELLDTNLVRVHFPERVHVATATLPYKDVRQGLLEAYGNPPSDWLLSGKRMWSFRDLSMPPFRDVTEEGTDEWLPTNDWIASDGDVTRRHFVDLLRRTLAEMLGDVLIYWRSKGYLFFKRQKNRNSRRHSYQSFQKKASRDVVKGYGRTGERPTYYRHAAFIPNFIEINGQWYLGIEPTYHFTSDGYADFRYAAERLSGIKRLETNQSVRGHIGMWKAFLIRQPDLLRKELLRFEDVSPLELGFGVADDLWNSNEDDQERKRVAEAQHEFAL